MAEKSRRDFLMSGAKAALGVGAVGVVGGSAVAGCVGEGGTSVATGALAGGVVTLNEAKLRQLTSYPDVRAEFVTALEQVADALLEDPNSYASFVENTDAVGSLRLWERDAALLADLTGDSDAVSKRGRLKRILAVSELYDGATGLDTTYEAGIFGGSSYGGSDSDGGCATNGSPTNGCCVIHTWGWSSGDGLC